MKRVLVIVTYEAYVPEDMTVESLKDNIDDTIRNRFDDLGVDSENYHNEDESWVIFNLEDVTVGTSAMISVCNE